MSLFLRGDGGIAPTGVGDTDTESKTADPITCRKVAKHGPRLYVRVKGRHHFRCTAILLLPQGAREQAIEM